MHTMDVGHMREGQAVASLATGLTSSMLAQQLQHVTSLLRRDCSG